MPWGGGEGGRIELIKPELSKIGTDGPGKPGWPALVALVSHRPDSVLRGSVLVIVP